MKNRFWIARDENGDLFMYDSAPIQDGSRYVLSNAIDEYAELCKNWFPEITFESGPVEVELTIKEVQQ